jgi:hypothetical protein
MSSTLRPTISRPRSLLSIARLNDVILDINGKPMQTPDEIPEALQDAYNAGRSATLMRLESGDMTRFIAVPFDPV